MPSAFEYGSGFPSLSNGVDGNRVAHNVRELLTEVRQRGVDRREVGR